MNALNRIVIKPVNLDDARLSLVIHDSIGDPSINKILEGIKSYNHPDYEMISVFVDGLLVQIIGGGNQ